MRIKVTEHELITIAKGVDQTDFSDMVKDIIFEQLNGELFFDIRTSDSNNISFWLVEFIATDSNGRRWEAIDFDPDVLSPEKILLILKKGK